MKTITLKLLIALLFLGVTFTSCDDDDDVIRGLEDRNIKIDDTQTFNMKNFAASFEQLFGGLINEQVGQIEFSHDVVGGKALQTYINFVSFGKFGNEAISYTHTYNAQGVVVSSNPNDEFYFGAARGKGAESQPAQMQYTYQFDSEGYIKEVFINADGALLNQMSLTYNQLKQVVSIKYERFYDTKVALVNTLPTSVKIFDKSHKTSLESNVYTEYYEKDAKGFIVKYWNDRMDEGDYVTYTYNSNNKLITMIFYETGAIDQTINLDYDSSNRVIKAYESGTNWKMEFRYSNETLSWVHFRDNNGEAKYSYIYEYKEKMVEVKYWRFRYDYSNSYAFEYCETKEYFYIDGHDRSLVSKKEYFEGTPENLVLVGYVTVDTRDAANEYKKTKESIYNANDTLLYYVTYEVSNNSIQSHKVYTADGTVIKDDDISNENKYWINELVENLSLNL